MNKKGFTLVELLAVVAIMAVIALIAVPNVVNMVDRNKKEQMITDAKQIIEKARYQLTLKKIDEGTHEISIFGYSDTKDGYGDIYIETASNVEIAIKDSRYVYYIRLETENHCLSNDGDECGYLEESDLDIDKVIDKK